MSGGYRAGSGPGVTKLTSADGTVVLSPAQGRGAVDLSVPSTGGRFVHIAHPGPPVVADGAFSAGQGLYDSQSATWLCTSSGTPGTWVPIIGKQRVDWPRPGPDATLAYEYNFTAGAALNTLPAGWAWLNRNGSTYGEYNGVGVLVTPGQAGLGPNGPNVSGVYYAFAAGAFGLAWYVTAKIRAQLRPAGNAYINAGLFVTDGTKLTTVQLQLTANTTTPPSIPQVVAQEFNSPTSFAGSTGPPLWPASFPLYFRINTGSAAQYVSGDGVSWAAIGAGSNLTPATITGVGFFGDQEYGAAAASSVVVSCEWIRVNTGAPPNLIGGGGSGASIG